MHNGEPQFDKPSFSVPIRGTKDIPQEEWDRIFLLTRSATQASPTIQAKVVTSRL